MKKKTSKMRYWYLDIEITCGEYEFHSKSLHVTKGNKFDEDTYVKGFYGDEPDEDDGTYYFFAGEIACQVSDIREITKKQHDILQDFI